MSVTKNTISRYSDQELEEFKVHITAKLEKTSKELNFIAEQIQEITEAMESEGDWMDDTSNASDLEMMYTMANRHRHHLRDLENALLRIGNKSYGICVVTGELIDKRRLMAVPTTTKSLQAKNMANPVVEKPVVKTPPARKEKAKKIITKVIKKNSQPTENRYAGFEMEDEDDEQDYLDFEDNDFTDDKSIEEDDFDDL